MTPIIRFMQQHIPHAMHSLPRASCPSFAGANSHGITLVVQSMLHGFRRNISWLPLAHEVGTWVIQKQVAVIPGNPPDPASAGSGQETSVARDATSRLVRDHLMNSPTTGTVLDLGCGEGSDSIPLHLKGWDVIAVDNQPEAVSAYLRNVSGAIQQQGLRDGRRPHVITGDLVHRLYPKNRDAVVCIDVLPYVPPEHLKRTMDKIFFALRPGGKFVGTLFFRKGQEGSPLTESMARSGAHFCEGKESARELLTRSGFSVKELRERDEGNPDSHCLEFLAERPQEKRS